MSSIITECDRLVVDVATKFSGGTKYSASAWHGGKYFESKASSTSSAAVSVAKKLKKADPNITHIRIDGFETALHIGGAE